MAGRIVQLADGGMTPVLRAASSRLSKEIWEAIDRASEAGIPAGLLVGHLEFIKAAIIQQNFQDAEDA